MRYMRVLEFLGMRSQIEYVDQLATYFVMEVPPSITGRTVYDGIEYTERPIVKLNFEYHGTEPSPIKNDPSPVHVYRCKWAE